VRFSGLLYRALNPVHAHVPLSGRGAKLYGGRFNPLGLPAIYTALSPTTAIRESNQVGTLQPTTLAAFRAEIEAVFDIRDPALMARQGLAPADLARDDWRDRACAKTGAPTQALAIALLHNGFSGLLVRSFAPGAGPDDLNLVLWQWNTRGARLQVVDDENRLGLT